MKFSINKELIFEFKPWQIDLIEISLNGVSLMDDMKRRAIYAVEKPLKKYINTHKEKINKELKELGVLAFPSTLENLAKALVPKDEMDKCEKIDMNCQSLLFNQVPSYLLALVCKFFSPADGECSFASTQVVRIFEEKIKRCLERMHFEWDKKLLAEGLSIPIDDEEFVKLVFSQDDFKNKRGKND